MPCPALPRWRSLVAAAGLSLTRGVVPSQPCVDGVCVEDPPAARRRLVTVEGTVHGACAIVDAVRCDRSEACTLDNHIWSGTDFSSGWAESAMLSSAMVTCASSSAAADSRAATSTRRVGVMPARFVLDRNGCWLKGHQDHHIGARVLSGQ